MSNLILPAHYNAGGGSFYPYSIAHSCRFNDDGSPYLYWTPASAGDRQKFTLSAWFKNIQNTCRFWSARSTDNDRGWSEVNGYRWRLDLRISGSVYHNTSTRVFRDPGSWYHVVMALDTTQGTAVNRYRLYVNGVEVTDWDEQEAIPQNEQLQFTNNVKHILGAHDYAGTPQSFWDGHVAEVILVDGVQCAPTDFGQFQNGVWVPKAYTGSYGTNGFYLDFANSANLGEDQSGNNNDFTASGLASTDQMTDTPTNNWPTLNPVDPTYAVTFKEGNLQVDLASASNANAVSTIQLPSSGKWYFETQSETGVGVKQGIAKAQSAWLYTNDSVGSNQSDACYWQDNATGFYVEGSAQSGYFSVSPGNTWVGFCVDMDNSKVSLVDSSGQLAEVSFSGNSADWVVFIEGNGDVGQVNFGQDTANVSTPQSDENGYGSFEYTPPSGFLALCSANLPDPAWMADPAEDSPADAFSVDTWDGNSGTQDITGLNFEPDMVWIKDRDNSNSHALFDSVRGALERLKTDTETADATESGTLTAFNSDGYSLGSVSPVNSSGAEYVGWSWLKSVDFGIDIQTYSGTQSKKTVSHDLGVAPKVIISCGYNGSSYFGRSVYHEGCHDSDPAGMFGSLVSGNAFVTSDNYWGGDMPTSTVFTVGVGATNNYTGTTYIAYLFAEVPGFSRFSYYIGNGNVDGPFVWCGFRPRWLLVKNVDTGATLWIVVDAGRDTHNPTNDILYPGDNSPEGSDNPNMTFDFLANGFKVREDDIKINASGDRYVFMAFAEHPFKYANAR